MAHVDRHAPGAFSWIELGTSDQDSAKNFYSSLFGWEIQDNPMGPGETYTMFNVEGRNAAACYTQGKDETSQGIPPHWNVYIATADADASAAKIKESGGTVLQGPFDVMSHGRMVIAMDPTGAAFCTWQAKEHHGIGINNQPNTLCWADCGTPDQEKAIAFYKSVFGWTIVPGQDAYVHIQNGEDMIGGIQSPSERPPDAPAAWLIYIMVDDCGGKTAKAKELGGSVILEPMTMGGVGKMSILRDPQGAVFALFQLTDPA